MATAPGQRGLPWRGLCLLLAHHFLAAAACRDAEYRPVLQELCLAPFQAHMDAIGQALWCDWDQTVRSYWELWNCTRQVAGQLGCAWPGAAVDRFFVAVHRLYFQACPATGRAVQDPPGSVLCSFIAVPVLVTLLVTLLVAWRSQRSEGVV
ncbi:receptor activity-modifying protein 1 [Sorex fumeus]|uniref:receptor activity-modifying protein 1 n=1 Tax=Sorex fumeus TaxID=62283 RepID=UPI0024AD4DE7|nr:receptor activity-modifying protein 1 [Sorex fumeus]